MLEALDELADENLGKCNQLLRLDLVIVVLVNRAEYCIDVLVSDRNADVVLTEEVTEELAKLATVQESVTIGVVVAEVLLHLLAELLLIALEAAKLCEGCLELAFVEICRIDHRV